jgi:hypothetical protein
VSDFKPQRRERGVKVEEFQGELLVYDLERHKAHCLNGAAVAVWQEADGTRSVPEIAARIAAAGGTEPDESVVWRTIEELEKASLLAAPVAVETIDAARRLFFHLGWATAVPLVLSIGVPTPAFAQSIATVT